MILDNYHVSDANKRNVIFAVGNDNGSTSYHDYPSIYSDTGGTWHSASQAVSHSTWTHITWSLTASLKRIYINGVERLSQSGSFGFDSTVNDDARIGGRASNGDFQYRGYIDQLALWTRELTATDAGHLYNSGSGNAFTPATANATGSFESNAITSSASISKMGAIITYQDNSGTNALNTDIVLKLSVSLETVKRRISERQSQEKRADDKEEIAIKRYETYEKNIRPVIDFYKQSNLLKVVKGEASISEINVEISDLIEAIKG